MRSAEHSERSQTAEELGPPTSGGPRLLARTGIRRARPVRCLRTSERGVELLACGE